LNLYFSWDVDGSDGNVKLNFEILNPELNLIIDEQTERVFENQISGKWDENKLFPGTFDIIEQTDNWKYLDNGAIE